MANTENSAKQINISAKLSLINLSRIVIYLMAGAVIAVCAILFPELAREEAVGKANPAPAYPFLIGAWALALPIFIALQQTLKLLSYIDQDKAFSKRSVRALQNIKYSSIVFSVLIALAIMSVIIFARLADPTEDVTGFVTLGFIFTFVPSVIATFVSVLQNLLQSAIDIKSENDLTV